jgi:hypothetical protein
VVAAAVLGLKFIALYIAIMWAALVFWVVRDIRQRTRDIYIQAAAGLLVLMFFIPGYWLYLVLRPNRTLKELVEDRYREAILAEYSAAEECPACHRKTREDYLICPHCEYSLRASCSSCSHAMLAGWKACPYCGTKSAPAAPVAHPVAAASLAPSNQPVHA